MAEVSLNYPWYSRPEGREITQGDILFDCPVLKPIEVDQTSEASEGSQIEGHLHSFTVVIMSQACDIAQKDITEIILCPLEVWDENAAKKQERWEKLQKNRIISRLLLNKDDGFPYHVVDFRMVFSLPKTFVEDFAERAHRRLRLLPPYREHLAQAFARFFMRVGLPIDIPEFGERDSNASRGMGSG